MSSRRTWIIDASAIFLLTVTLIWPLFRLKYLDNWSSIESTFIADARMLRQHWNLNGWQPVWYCGTRFDYIYPPALRVGTALLTLIPNVVPARAYHLYTAFFYCVGIAGVYLLVRSGSGSRRAAWLCAAAAALISPSFWFLPEFRGDAVSSHLAPMRLHVLMKYGEGPHMSSFALIPIALAAAWQGLQRGRLYMLLAAAAGSALVVSNNFYGATALVIFFPLLCWSLWVALQDHRIWLRAASIAALAYGLTSFWLTPSYVRITLQNMRLVAEKGNSWSIALAALVAILFGGVTWTYVRGKPQRAWGAFVCGSLLFFALNVLGKAYFGFRVIGEPHRLVPELDLTMILAGALAARWIWKNPNRIGPLWLRNRPWISKTAVILLLLAAFADSRQYLRHAWTLFPLNFRPDLRIEYKIADWLSRHMPESRIHAAGSIRLWFNAWHDVKQVGGGSQQGLLNQALVLPEWEITRGADPELSILWLQALGADAVVVFDPESEEIWNDYVHPKKFEGLLEKIFDDNAGNRIYRVPRRFPERARVVEATRILSLPPIQSLDCLPSLRAYIDAIERGPDRRVALSQDPPNRMRLRVSLEPGQAILVQESFDPAWRAYSGTTRLRIHQDPVSNFLLIEAPPGDHEIRLEFELPLENAVGRALAVASVALILLLAFRGRKGPAGMEGKRSGPATIIERE
ncbi:MAG: hypothetical protein IRZ15_07760 [Bryobacteraceae bacterium]|nr:hypothetical protein [Bryobacteraceae bacterium]